MEEDIFRRLGATLETSVSVRMIIDNSEGNDVEDDSCGRIEDFTVKETTEEEGSVSAQVDGEKVAKAGGSDVMECRSGLDQSLINTPMAQMSCSIVQLNTPAINAIWNNPSLLHDRTQHTTPKPSPSSIALSILDKTAIDVARIEAKRTAITGSTTEHNIDSSRKSAVQKQSQKCIGIAKQSVHVWLFLCPTDPFRVQRKGCYKNPDVRMNRDGTTINRRSNNCYLLVLRATASFLGNLPPPVLHDVFEDNFSPAIIY